jgi:hypothetical protein
MYIPLGQFRFASSSKTKTVDVLFPTTQAATIDSTFLIGYPEDLMRQATHLLLASDDWAAVGDFVFFQCSQEVRDPRVCPKRTDR